MKFWKKLKSSFRNRASGVEGTPFGARNYEIGQSNRHVDKHFTNATNKDADSLINADLATLRNRALY